MANLLTGAYEAVLQVSQDTLNRLLASMHQHRDTKPHLPSFPHSAAVRLGDQYVVDGVRGTAWAQVGVPRMTFIDGATDRFQLEVGLRIQYQPDPDTEPLAPHSKGTLRAIYALEDIDPSCPGWRKLARTHFWVRVVEDSVSFSGTYGVEDITSIAWLEDAAVLDAKMTTQLRALLSYSFEPAPQEVPDSFRKGSFKSIVQAQGSIDEMPMLPLEEIPIGGAAVAIPFGILYDPPLPAIGSITNVLLAGSDFGMAVNADTIMAMVDPALDQIRAYAPSFKVSVSGLLGSVSTVYHSAITGATATWVPHGSYANVVVAITGQATTASVLPNFGVSVTQLFTVEFDAGSESFFVWASSPGVQLTASGLGLPSNVLQNMANEIAAAVKSMADGAANQVQPSLNALTAGKAEFVKTLKTLDDEADARFDGASFYLSGVVARGWVSVAGRRRPKVKFKKVGDEHFTAYESWIPGGRIDRYKWSWTWKSSSGTPGASEQIDRYVLRRPAGGAGKFGLVGLLYSPLPGLDGGGQICLTVVGKVVDVDTGRLVAIEAGPVCAEYGLIDPWRVGPYRLDLRDYPNAVPSGGPHPPDPVEHAVVHVNSAEHPVGGANTLIVYVDEGWNDELEHALVEGLDGCSREDAGLLVLVLFREGVLHEGRAPVRGQLEELAERLQAPVVVNEDVGGGWTNAFVMPRGGQPSFRLLSPDGGVLWMKDGSVEGRELTQALDALLYPSGPVQTSQVHVDLGSALVNPDVLGGLFGPRRPERSHCPDWRGLAGADVRTAVTAVAFLRKESPGFDEQVRRLQEQHGNRSVDDPDVVVVLDGAEQRDADELAAALGTAFTVIPDADGSRARAVGVRVWPTTVTLADVDDIAVSLIDEEDEG